MIRMLSIVIPTLNEAAILPGLLGDLRALRVVHEVIVVDGDSTDQTRQLASRCGARVVRATRGRGPQLRAGVKTARGEVLCFLHADARLSHAALAALEWIAGNCPDGVAHAFTLRIAGEGWRYRFVEWGTDRRSRWGKLPYGDQGLILTRATYERAGGFPPLPLMEDVALVRRIRRQARIVILPERIDVSARRWEKDGVLRRMLRNWLLLGAYLAGVDADRLAAAYRPHVGAQGAA